MKTKKNLKLILILVCFTVFLSSCAKISDWVSTTKGKLFGNDYTIYQYDNYGSPTLEIKGSSIEISPYDATISNEGETTINSVLDITIDGKQILSVGNTLIFEQEGIDKIAGFDKLSSIYSESNFKYIPIDKMINSFKNDFGKARIIVVSSQLGEPIGIYQGDSVYVAVPDDLPKMTRINIDGKSLYLHRVNYTIIDSSLVEK